MVDFEAEAKQEAESAVPPSVRALLRYATERGIKCEQWFSADEGSVNQGGAAAASARVGATRRILSSAEFQQKMTHMGLALAVGRPMEEQMTIERALSTNALDRTVSASGASGSVDVDWIVTLSRSSTSKSASSVPSPAPIASSSSSSTLRSSSSKVSSSSRSGAQSSGSADLSDFEASIAKPPSVPAAHGGLFSARPPLPPQAPQAGKAQRPQLQKPATQQQTQVQAIPTSWAALEEDAEEAMRVVVRHHADTYFNLRMQLGLTALRGSNGSGNDSCSGGSKQSLEEWEHLRNPNMVGAAAASVLKNGNDGGNLPVAPADAPPLPPRVVTLFDLKRALYACELRWPSVQVAALFRRMASKAGGGVGGDVVVCEEDETPSSLPAGTVKRYLLKLKLTHMVHWDEWFGKKRAAFHAQHRRLLGAFEGVLAG